MKAQMIKEIAQVLLEIDEDCAEDMEFVNEELLTLSSRVLIRILKRLKVMLEEILDERASGKIYQRESVYIIDLLAEVILSENRKVTRTNFKTFIRPRGLGGPRTNACGVKRYRFGVITDNGCQGQ